MEGLAGVERATPATTRAIPTHSSIPRGSARTIAAAMTMIGRCSNMTTDARAAPSPASAATKATFETAAATPVHPPAVQAAVEGIPTIGPINASANTPCTK